MVLSNPNARIYNEFACIRPHTFGHAAPVQPGTIIAGRFVIERLAGAGGMGRVYRAMDRDLNQCVALKVVAENAPGHAKRFVDEARILSALTHPSIVGWIAHGQDSNGDRWLALEWLDGEDLDTRLTRGPLSVLEGLGLGIAAAEALAAAHAHGVIHRDIKPSNIFLVEGDPCRTKLLDFGVARRDSVTRAVTRSGVVVGTAGYIPPEQFRGDPLDARADVFGLGAVLYECFAGQPAFAGGSMAAVLRKLLLTEPPSLRSLRDDIPAELDTLIKSMLAKEPSERPADATSVANALRRVGQVNHQRVGHDNAFGADPVPVLALEAKAVRALETFDPSSLFVGRDRDVSSLLGLFEDCAGEGLARAVLITGPVGIGKTRLGHETRERLKMPTNAQVWTAQAVVRGHQESFGLLKALLRYAENENTIIVPEFVRRITATVEVGPLVIVLEDFQWADEGSVKAIDDTLDRLSNRPLFVVALARPEIYARFPRLWADRDVQEIRLNELSRRHATQLVKHELGDRTEKSVIDAIVRRCAGHPFYLEHLARAFAAGQRDALPDAVLVLVHGLLAELSQEERRFLRAASVFGDVCWTGGVLYVLDGGLADVARTLVERGVLARNSQSRWPGEDELSFREPIVGEAIHALLRPEDRILGERRARAWLDSMSGSHHSEFDAARVKK
jgi:Protein kinase domain/AAA ATPase domain